MQEVIRHLTLTPASTTLLTDLLATTSQTRYFFHAIQLDF